MAVSDAHVFPGLLSPVLTQLFFQKPWSTILTCFSRGERQKYARKKVRLNQESNSQPPGHESDMLTWTGLADSRIGWLVVLGFNATLTAKVISWQSVPHIMCFLAFSQRWEAKIQGVVHASQWFVWYCGLLLNKSINVIKEWRVMI